MLNLYGFIRKNNIVSIRSREMISADDSYRVRERESLIFVQIFSFLGFPFGSMEISNIRR